jgi:anti-anti-sigma factor
LTQQVGVVRDAVAMSLSLVAAGVDCRTVEAVSSAPAKYHLERSPTGTRARLVLDACGEIDIATGGDFSQHVMDAAQEAGRHDAVLVVDLSEVTFIGVYGLNALVAAAGILDGSHGPLFVRSPPTAFAASIQALGLSRLVVESPR